MITFTELTKQVHLINDLILSDMIFEGRDFAEETVIFSKHLLATKHWFASIAYTNKKRYILALLQDVRSAWTISLLLKSLWNCRLKDAVMSVSEPGHCLSSFDQVPMDHNRTALPETTLAQVMKNDRAWFVSLDPESQALVLCELLTVAGAPAMCEVLYRAEIVYERYRTQLLPHVQECTHDPEKMVKTQTTPTTAQAIADTSTKAEKELEANLAIWNATIKAMKDSLKLEEFKVDLSDGTKRTVWKVNRLKPDMMESVDFLQLLPSAVGKRILSFLPRTQLGDYAKINKYWAYLIDDYRAELAARVKIDADFMKMNDLLNKHDASFDNLTQQNCLAHRGSSEHGGTVGSVMIANKAKHVLLSFKASEKSSGANSMRFITEKLLAPKLLIPQKPIQNMADLYERVEQRGATDEHIWKWCENIQKRAMKVQTLKGKKKQNSEPFPEQVSRKEDESILILGNVHFPCPLMKLSLVVPLKPPLCKDPANFGSSNITKSKGRSESSKLAFLKAERVKRHNLWTRDASSLFPVLKIPSYHF